MNQQPPPVGAGEAPAVAARAAGVHMEPAHDAAQCTRIVALFNDVWGASVDVMDLGILVALAHGGGCVSLARDGGAVLGAGVGFFGSRGAPFHSHVVGVARNARARGVAYAIKLHQRAWCLEHGIGTMNWTFDPLVARNAHFNIAKLGARPIPYYPDFYGGNDR